jgi:hypothetical protein
LAPSILHFSIYISQSDHLLRSRLMAGTAGSWRKEGMGIAGGVERRSKVAKGSLEISRFGASHGSHRNAQEPGLTPKRLMNNPC